MSRTTCPNEQIENTSSGNRVVGHWADGLIRHWVISTKPYVQQHLELLMEKTQGTPPHSMGTTHGTAGAATLTHPIFLPGCIIPPTEERSCTIHKNAHIWLKCSGIQIHLVSAVSFGPKLQEPRLPAHTPMQHPHGHLTEARTRGSTRCICSKLCTCSSASWQATLGKSHFSSHHHLFSQWGHSFKSVSLAQPPIFLVLIVIFFFNCLSC